jgi:hypothetical protein
VKDFLSRYFAELVIVAAIVFLLTVILIVILIAAVFTEREFKDVCDRANGTTVYDGRQYQCIKEVSHGR